MDASRWNTDGEPKESVGKKRGELPPSIPVVLTLGGRLDPMWHPSDQCEMRGGIQRGMISEATPSICQNLRVPDEKPVPLQIILGASCGVHALMSSEESVQQPQALCRGQCQECPGVICSRMVRMEIQANGYLAGIFSWIDQAGQTADGKHSRRTTVASR